MRLLTVLVVLVAFFSGVLSAGVRGDYLEARTSDVYTGPCFANSEVNLTGKEAILAWRIREGTWQGVDLTGLGVVAVVKSNATLGDPFSGPTAVRALLVVDEAANPRQRDALIDFSRNMGGRLLENLVDVQSAPIDLRMEGHGSAWLKAGDIAQLHTRSLHEGDHLCGNEEVYYPPLAPVEAHPAYTRLHEFRGDGLGGHWSSPSKRSAFVGHFER